MLRFFFRDLDAAGGGGPVANATQAPTPTPLDVAFATARAQVAAGQSIMPATPGAPNADPAAPAPTQARNADGTFAGTDPAAPAAAPDANAAPAAIDPATGQPVAGDPAQPEAAPDGADSGELGGDDLVVAIPGRREGDPDVELRLGSQAEVERVRQLMNAAGRAGELRQAQLAVEHERQQITEITARLQYDPEGFLFDSIPEDRRATVAFQALLEPATFAAVQDLLREVLEDPQARETARLTLENERLKNRGQVEVQLAAQREAAQNATAIKQQLAMLVPDTLPKQAQVALFEACQQDVVEVANRLQLNRMDPRDVLAIVAPRLRSAGVDPMQVAFPATRPANTTTQNATAPAARAPVRPAPVQPTGPALVAAQAAALRAATTPSGGVAPPSSAAVNRPPAGQSLEERFQWAKTNLKFG